MTGPDLAAHLRDLKLTKVKFASIIGVSRQQVHNWVTGHTAVPKFVEVIIYLWLEHGRRTDCD